MLAYILALTVGLGSLGIYLAAFFFPEVHRKNDFIWSGVGLFYALVLWVCAGRITGGLLLGQAAGVALLTWSVTQTLQLRRQLTPAQQQTEIPSAEQVKSTVQGKISNLSLPERLSQLGKQVSGSASTAKNRLQQNLNQPQKQSTASGTVTVDTTSAPQTPPERPTNVTATPQSTTAPESAAETVAEVIQPNAADLEQIQQTESNPPAVNQPVFTEAEAVPQTGETTLAEAATSTTPEPIPPHPPDPEIVKSAIQDAKEKAEDYSPPESLDPDSSASPKNQEPN